jgi:ABC-type bacteriocin/lantibiotic exporter with double-glycine peptidase domain
MPIGLLAVPHRAQEQPWTCVPACVRMILAYLGDQREESEIAGMVGTTPRGTRLADLTDLQSWGYDVSVIAGDVVTLERLIDGGVPAIISVHTSQLPYCPLPPWDAHAVVVIGTSQTGFTVLDPEKPDGGLRVGRGALQRAWGMRRFQMAIIRSGR